MVYKYRSFRFPVPAQVVGEELEKIEAKEGELTKENVLKAARAKSSKIHKCFEWDNEKAAEKFRLHQANLLIDSVVVIYDEAPDTEVRAFVNIGDNAQGRFISVRSALENAESKDIVLARAIAELQAFKRKYENLSELSKVFSVIAELVA